MQLSPEHLQYLDKRVHERTCTAQELIALFHHQQAGSLEMGNLPVPNYITDAELPSMWAALDWWPKQGLSSTHDFSTLDRISLFSVYIPNLTPPLRAMEILTRKAQEVAGALEAAGVSVVNPNETKEERKSRKAREAQKRFRDKQKAAVDPAIEAARIAYLSAYDAYTKLCAERKKAEAYFKQQIAEATVNYQKLQADYDKLRK